ncbi:MAG: hypothetical protein U5L11_17460 [Arhodomonas sp.]|nr:hypothetical protein [Arhodomonas sp.]
MGASRLRKPLRAGLVLVGLLAGAGLLALALLHRETPQRGAVAADAPAVTVIEVAPARFRLEARGYGVARAAERWHATANVGGRVVERHARLESGNILAEGTQLLALDPTRYQLAIADAEAEIASLDAELEQLDTEEANTRSLLGLERERLALAEEELSRIERLAEQGSVSRSQRDEQRRATIAQRQAVAKLDNELSLIPVRRNRLEAQRERARTRVQQAREDLEDTRFTAPYDLRVSAVEVERHDQVSPGQVLFEADSVAATEVEAHIQLPMLRRLMGGLLSPLTEPAPIPWSSASTWEPSMPR